MSVHGLSRFLFYADLIRVVGVLFPIASVTPLSFFADAGHHAPQMQESDGGIK